MRTHLLALFLVGPLFTACDGLWGSTHCDFRETETPPRCQQRDGAMGVAFQRLCDVTDGEPQDGPCPEENRVAGCMDPSAENPAQHVVDWYYVHDVASLDAVRTRDDVRKICDEDGYTVVDP